MTDGVPCEVGLTKESLMQSDEPERLRTINRMTGACPDLLVNHVCIDCSRLS